MSGPSKQEPSGSLRNAVSGTSALQGREDVRVVANIRMQLAPFAGRPELYDIVLRAVQREVMQIRAPESEKGGSNG